MKSLFCLIVLFAFIAFSGCSEKSQAPVAPQDNSSTGNPASLSKMSIQKARVWQYSIKLMDPGVRTEINGRLYWRGLKMEDRFETPNPLLNGQVINTVNVTEDMTTGKGIIGGTLIVKPYANVGGGRWEIAYAGKIEATGATTSKATINGVGRGVGGDINGMIYTADFVIYSDISEAGITWEGAGNAYLTHFTPFKFNIVPENQVAAH